MMAVNKNKWSLFLTEYDLILALYPRFDKHVVVPMPDVQGRFDILELHMKGIPRAPGVDLKTIARATPGLSGVCELHTVYNPSVTLKY